MLEVEVDGLKTQAKRVGRVRVERVRKLETSILPVGYITKKTKIKLAISFQFYPCHTLRTK